MGFQARSLTTGKKECEIKYVTMDHKTSHNGQFSEIEN